MSSNSEATLIQLEPRTYHLDCPDSGPPRCLLIDRAKSIRIAGVSGQTRLVVQNPRKGFLAVNATENFELSGVTIDYATALRFKDASKLSTQRSSLFTVALYRCYLSSLNSHFVSVIANCEGQQNDGLLGYMSPTYKSGQATTPIYRCSKSSGHLFTNSQSECLQNGFIVEALMGYAK